MEHLLHHYPDYNTTQYCISSLKARHPQINVLSFGKSVYGRPLRCLCLGNMRSPLLFVGGVHGSEYQTVSATLILAQTLTQPEWSHILRKQGVLIVPCLNPDGTELFINGVATAPNPDQALKLCEGNTLNWKANGRGIDLNRNFDFYFSKSVRMAKRAHITRPGPTRYGGTHAFSEPETKALRHLCYAYQPCAMLCLHSQGEEIYADANGYYPPKGQQIGKMLENISGFKLCRPNNQASFAGAKDWFIHAFNKPGFTIEMGLGENPLPLSTCQNNIDRALPILLSLIVYKASDIPTVLCYN